MLARLVLAMGLLIGAATAQAQMPPAPTDNEIQQRVASDLPPIWNLDKVTLGVAVDSGTPIEPRLKRRYQADISLKADTYAVAGRDGPVTFVQQVGKAKDTKSIYGILTEHFAGGRWITDVVRDNDPTAGIGLPRDALPGKVIVKGSPDETAYWTEREAEKTRQHDAEVADLKRQAALADENRKKELAKLEAQTKLQADAEALRQKQAADARAMQEKQAAEARARTVAMQHQFDDKIRSRIAVDVKAPWSVTAIAVDDAAITGLDDQAMFQMRFRAEVTLAKDTFSTVSSNGPIQFVTLVAHAGDKRELTGVAQIRQQAGQWTVAVTYNNIIVLDQLGSSRDQLPGRVILKGSPEEEEYRKSIEAELDAKNAAELAGMKREEAVKAQERAAELAKVADETRIAEEKRRQEANAESRRAEAMAALDKAISAGDEGKIRSMLGTALASGDTEIPGKALRAILSQKAGFVFSGPFTSINGTAPRPGGGPIVVNMKFDQFDKVTGGFTGDLTGDLFQPNLTHLIGPGQVTGPSIGLSKDSCSLSLALADANTLKGVFKCRTSLINSFESQVVAKF